MPDPRNVPRTSLLYLVVAVVAVVAFAEPLGGSWIFDDRALIPGNRFVHELGAWPHWFSSHLWDTNYDPRSHKEFASFWRPLVLASYAVDWHFGSMGTSTGTSSALFHVTNLLWHAVTALFAFAALRRWSGSILPAFVAALAFAIHPTKAESVAWISGRADVMCAAGTLLACQGIATRLRGKRTGVAAEVLGTAIAYLSKEAAVALPLFALVEAWAFDRAVDRAPLSEVNRRRLVLAAAPQAAVALAYLVARHVWLPIGGPAAASALTTHVALAFESLGRYLALIGWPGDLSLGRAFVVHADGRPVASYGYVALGVLGLAAALGIAALLRRRRPSIAVGTLLFVGALLPVCNVVSTGYSVLVSPRFLYLPSIGLALVAADLIETGVRAVSPARAATIGVSLAAVLALLARSTVRSADFDSEERFWGYERAHVPYYPPALLFEVSRALNDRRPRAALGLARDAYTTLLRLAPTDLSRSELVLLTMQAVLVLTPDIARDDLAALRRFASDVGAGRSGHLVSAAADLTFDVQARDPGASLLTRSLEVEMLRGDISSRLGEDRVAIDAAHRLARECPHCWTLSRTGILIAARAGDLSLARRLRDALAEDSQHADRELDATLDLAQRLRDAIDSSPASALPLLRTQYYSLLGAWGRAYFAAAPALSDPTELDAASAARLGELACRAGDRAAAERLLARELPRESVRMRIDEIARSMHWIDAPDPID